MDLEYDVSTAEPEIKVPVSVVVKNEELIIELGQIPDFEVKLSPRGEALDALTSNLLKSFAEDFANSHKDLLRSELSSMKLRLISVKPVTANGLVVTIDSLTVGSHNVEGVDVLKLVPVFSIASTKCPGSGQS